MRIVVATDQGVLELNWTWLPTFIGMDASLRKELQAHVADKFEGKEMTAEVLQEAHNAVVSFLVSRYKAIKGLDRYLDALKFIEIVR